MKILIFTTFLIISAFTYNESNAIPVLISAYSNQLELTAEIVTMSKIKDTYAFILRSSNQSDNIPNIIDIGYFKSPTQPNKIWFYHNLCIVTCSNCTPNEPAAFIINTLNNELLEIPYNACFDHRNQIPSTTIINYPYPNFTASITFHKDNCNNTTILNLFLNFQNAIDYNKKLYIN